KVLDFGLAKAVWGSEEAQNPTQPGKLAPAQTMAGHVLGTPPYMSPEQARGQEVDRRTDIWAFGCVLYGVLTGKRAFRGETLQNTVQAILESEPDWTSLPPKTPPNIINLIKRCLEKDIRRRVQEIADARSAIEKVQKGRNHWQSAAVAA